MRKLLLTHILFIFFTGFLNSQQKSSKISCTVLDSKTKKPVVYATVMLKKINRGTHANYNGNFEIPSKYIKDGTIQISSIGYKTKEVKLSNLQLDKTNIIYLKISTNSLQEVVVKSNKKKKKLLAKQIVRKAIRNILENSPTQPHSYIGYYRDYQQPVGNSYQKVMKIKKPIEYLNVHEAILQSFDYGFTSDKLKDKQNQTSLFEYKVNSNFLQDSTLTIPYDNKSKKYSESVYITPLGGNELNILDLTNSIRNHDKMSFSFVNIFNRDFLNNHKFKLKEVVFLDDIPIYKIYFTSLKNKTSYEYSAFGYIYISKSDFAIHKLNYNLYYRKKDNPQYSVTIEYKPLRDKMYLNYISFNNFFEATNGNYFKIDKTFFNSKTNSFKIYFNRQLNMNSLEPFKRNFKIYYKGKKLKIFNVNTFENRLNALTVSVDKNSLEKLNFEAEKRNPNYAKYFVFDISNIKDIDGYFINERPSIKINQYRELFVQEIIENKKLPEKYIFINKKLPLAKSKITPTNFKDAFWINSPLKKKKKE